MSFKSHVRPKVSNLKSYIDRRRKSELFFLRNPNLIRAVVVAYESGETRCPALSLVSKAQRDSLIEYWKILPNCHSNLRYEIDIMISELNYKKRRHLKEQYETRIFLYGKKKQSVHS